MRAVFEGRYYSGLILNRYSLASSDFNLNRHIVDSQKTDTAFAFQTALSGKCRLKTGWENGSLRAAVCSGS